MRINHLHAGFRGILLRWCCLFGVCIQLLGCASVDLRTAVFHNDTGRTKQLLETGVKPSPIDLWLAVAYGNQPITQLLIDKGVDVNANKNDCNPLPGGFWTKSPLISLISNSSTLREAASSSLPPPSPRGSNPQFPLPSLGGSISGTHRHRPNIAFSRSDSRL